MSKFYKYINEGYGKSRVELISESDAKDSIRYNCKKSVQSTPIYRGVKSFKDSFGFGNSENQEKLRMSANTANYYTLIIDNSKEWSSFPKRSKSFVCTTNIKSASNYGTPYRTIPFDNTPIGVCPAGDIWDSFQSEIFDLSILNDAISLAASMLNLDIKKMQNDYKYLLKSLDEIGKDYKDENSNSNWLKMQQKVPVFLENFGESNMKFSEYLINVLSPKQNKFKLVKAGDQVPTNKEVWFQGKSIFIKLEKVNEIIKEYGDLWKWANDMDGDKGVAIT